MSMEVQTGGSECYPTPRGSEVDMSEVQTGGSECYHTPRGSEVDTLETITTLPCGCTLGNVRAESESGVAIAGNCDWTLSQGLASTTEH